MTVKLKNGMDPTHPGEILREDFLSPKGMTRTDFILQAIRKMEVKPTTATGLLLEEFEGVCEEKLPVSYLMADILSAGTGSSAQFWMNLQEEYDRKTK